MTEEYNDTSVDLEQVLDYFKKLVGDQAQQIAVLTALTNKLQARLADNEAEPVKAK